MKEAGRETRRLHAMASAWELKEVEHYQKLLHFFHQCNQGNLRTFDTLSRDMQHLNKLIRFKHHEYSEELASMVTSDRQLNVLEAEVKTHLLTRPSCSRNMAAPHSGNLMEGGNWSIPIVSGQE